MIKSKELKGHNGAVHKAIFNSKGEYIVSGSADKTIKIWNPLTTMCIKTYSGHGKDIFGIVVSKDNSKFASASADRQVFLWDVSSGKTLRRFAGHTHRANCVAFNSDSSVIISGSYDATARLWDCKSQSRLPIQILNEAKDDISSVHILGHEILVASVDQHVRIYDMRAAAMIQDNVGHPVTSATFSGDGNCILTSCLDSKIRLFDKENGELLNEYKGHKNTSYKIESCLSNSDSHVVSGDEDGKVFFWELVEGEITKSFDAHKKAVESVSYHPREDMLATGSSDGTIKVWSF